MMIAYRFFNIVRHGLFLCLMLTGMVFFATSCKDDTFDLLEEENPEGYLSLRLDVGESTRAESPSSLGEDSPHHENTVSTLDLFFFKDADSEATFAYHKVLTSEEQAAKKALIPISDVDKAFGETGRELLIYGVANCPEAAAKIDAGITGLTLDKLKAVTTSTDGFRAAAAPANFVMTAFDGSTIVTLSDDRMSATSDSPLKLRRVAAKIRIAANVAGIVYTKNGQTVVKEEETEPDRDLLDQGYTRWTPDVRDMRVFINNGVRTARLDGKLIGEDGSYLLELKDTEAETDYYSISTSGNKETEDYTFSRPLKNTTPVYEEYPYYTETPLYSYPNVWEDSSTESHTTTLTVVIPWETEENNEEGDDVTWRPTYYTVQVNNKENKIESNKYYYLRLHVGKIGGLTSLTPVVLDPLECEILNWGSSNDSEADLRPQRFLYFSEEEFIMNNEYKIEIPFASTHKTVVKDGSFKGTYYYFKGDYGEENPLYFNLNTKVDGTGRNDPLAKGYFYDYTIDNDNFTLTVWQKFTESIFSADNLRGDRYISGGYKDRLLSGNQNLYTRVELDFTLKHEDLENGTEYEVPIHITIFPAAYLTAERIPDGTTWENRGWLYVNGYATGNAGTGGLGDAGYNPAGRDNSRCLTTVTLTQLNAEEKAKWVIGDPRTAYINNNMSDESMKYDYYDITDDWGDSFDGSQTGNNRQGECRTIWSYYNNNYFNVPDWSNGVDVNPRGIKYYYPTSIQDDKKNYIGPKLILPSRHGYSDDLLNAEKARRRCATYQMYGYPAGRWRLPTPAEIALIKTLQNKNLILDIFTGNGRYWSSMGSTTDGVNFSQTNAYVRCVYDLWYWEEVDGANGRIPYEKNTVPGSYESKALYKIFTWGDKPKQNHLEPASDDEPTVGSFLKKHGKGNYKVIRSANGVKLEKMK